MPCPNCASPLPPGAGHCPVCQVPLRTEPPSHRGNVADPAERRARLAFRFESLLTLGALFEARDLAREAAEQEENAAERAIWTERSSSLVAQLRRDLRIRVIECQGAPMPDFLAATYSQEDPSCWLSPSGQRLYLVAAYGRWLFIRVYDMTSHRLRTQVSLRAPEAIDRPYIVAEENTLWILDSKGHVLELSSSTWEVLSWRPGGSLCAPDEEALWVALTPSTRILWVVVSKDSFETVRILRLGQRNSVPETLDEAEAVRLVPGISGLQVMTTELMGGRLYSQAGELLEELPDDYDIVHGTAAPGGEGLLLLASTGGDLHSPLVVVQVSPDGTCSPTVTVEGSSSFRPSALATSRQAQLGFVFSKGRRGDAWLTAFSEAPHNLEPVFRIPVEDEVTLVQDAFAQRAVLLAPTDDDTAVISLGREAPKVSGAERAESQLPVVAGYTICWCALPPTPEPVTALARHLAAQPEEARELTVAETLRKHGQDAETLLALCVALELRFHADLSARLVSFLLERHAGNPAIELHHAGLEIGARKWSAGLNRLAQLDASTLNRRQTCHLHHLRGLAHYHLGKPVDALAEFRRGEPLDDENTCKLKQWIALASGVAEPDPLGTQGSNQPYLQQLVGAIRAADDFLARGDATSTAKVLDRWMMWRCNDLQGLARLTQAWLLLTPSTEAEQFRKALVLAAFARRQGDRSRGFELDLPPETAWDEKRFGRLAQQAREWLEQAG